MTKGKPRETGPGVSYMTCDVLIDTNVLVYAYDPGAGEKQRQAFELIDYWAQRKRGALSVQVLSEFIVVASHKLNPPLEGEELLASIDRLSRAFNVLPLTPFIPREAVRGMQTYKLSYWDAQIWAVARLNQVPIILTEDLPGQKCIEGVLYENPFS